MEDIYSQEVSPSEYETSFIAENETSAISDNEIVFLGRAEL